MININVHLKERTLFKMNIYKDFLNSATRILMLQSDPGPRLCAPGVYQKSAPPPTIPQNPHTPTTKKKKEKKTPNRPKDKAIEQERLPAILERPKLFRSLPPLQ